ncbi:MAG TPA: hypothetical protein VFN64_07065 [Burkholderiaceae bacterium]|nr:hypothetical protein [Burkholderiaceae bacterium]
MKPRAEDATIGTLWGAENAAAKPKAARKRKPPPADTEPSVKRAVDCFHDRFVERFGFKPDPRYYGRFARDVKQLIAAWGEKEVLALIDEFFATRDPRVARSDYTAAAFLGLAQHLRVRQTGQAADERTQQNLDAADRAMGRRR